MNRRAFLTLSAAAPIVKALPSTPKVDISRADITSHDAAVFMMLYRNLQLQYQWQISRTLLHDPPPCDAVRRMLDFIDQYQTSIVRHVAAVQPMIGPTAIVFFEDDVKLHEDPFFPPRGIEAAQDFHAIYNGTGVQRPESFEKIETMSVIACSKLLDSPDMLADTLDRQIIRTLLYIAKDGAPNHQPTFVLTHPDNLQAAQRFSHPAKPLVTEQMDRYKILMGDKLSEYNAPIIYAPYVPLEMIRCVSVTNYLKLSPIKPREINQRDIEIAWKTRYSLVVPYAVRIGKDIAKNVWAVDV